jgi:intein/homing endonuclease
VASKETSKSLGISHLIRSAGHQAKSILENTQQAEDMGDLSEVAYDGRRVKIFNVLQYAESTWGLKMKLYPVQRFIVKLYYHIPLGDTEKTIVIYDMFKTKVLYRFTEVEYLRFLFSEGRCNIGEQDHVRRQLILAIGRRSGKCVSGDTLVLTSNGIFRIDELGSALEEESVPTSIGVIQEAGRRSIATAFYNGGVKTTFRVTTDSGYSESGTGNHRVKVMSNSGYVEWRYLDELQVGDFVAINRTTDLWSSSYLDIRPYHNSDGYKDLQLPDVLDEKLGNLIGYLVGDGSWSDKHAVAVTVEHPETWTYLTRLFTEIFGPPRTQMDKRTDNTGRLEFCSVKARRFLDSLGWGLDCARNEKMIPWSILRSPKSVVCAFLRGLFETDGCAENGGSSVTFSSASFRLAHEVQVLLLNLGIVSSVHKKWGQRTQKHYAVLAIKGFRSRRAFAELVGFDSEKKGLPLRTALVSAQEGRSDTDSVPHQISRARDWLNSIPKRNPARGELGWGRSKLREALGNTIKPDCDENLTYSRIQSSIQVAESLGAGVKETEHFKELLQLDYFYDEVVSVERGEDQVYDLTVPDGESFVANGFTNHNTTLSAIFASYELYRLISLGNPQEYYGLPNGNRIQIISVATDKDQAGLLFSDVTSHMSKCEFFQPYIANNTLSYVQFRTPYDIERYGPTVRHENGKFASFNGKASLRVTFKASVSKGLRGSGNIVIILDELAHFQDKGVSSAKDIYDAITPSALAFSHKNLETNEPIGPVESRIISISSPLNRAGKFYELFHFAMSKAEGSENLLAIQAPTWEVYRDCDPTFLREKFHEDPTVFMTEYGAQFSDRVRGWVEREDDLLACIKPDRKPIFAGRPRSPHQMGIDVGLIGDGTAVFITHADSDRIVQDYHEVWYAGVPWRESNPHLLAPLIDYAKIIETVDRLDFDALADWIFALCKRFYITDGLFDRWSGLPLEQSLHKKGLKQFHSEFFTQDEKSRMFQAVKLLMFDRKLELYDYPIPTTSEGGKHSPFIAEILGLEATQRTKNQIIVEAPKVAGLHDDVSDAFVRATWLSLARVTNIKLVSKNSFNNEGYARQRETTPHNYRMARMRKHGIVFDRFIPKSLSRRLP